MQASPWKIIRLKSVDSTNIYAKNLAAEGADRTAVVADEQSAGRGRIGRSFYSGAGLGLYLTAIFRPRCAPEKTGLITPLAAVAVSRAIWQVSGISADIKWVNDLQVGGKKLCGILTELSFGKVLPPLGGTGEEKTPETGVSFAVVGIGINVSHSLADFPAELRPIVTSLAIEGAEVSREALALAVLSELDAVFPGGQLPDESALPALRAEYAEKCVTLGRQVDVVSPAGSRAAVALSLTDSFALTVEYEDGSREDVSSGEVSVRAL